MEDFDQVSSNADAGQLSWLDFLKITYGCCAGLELERAEQGEFEEREMVDEPREGR